MPSGKFDERLKDALDYSRIDEGPDLPIKERLEYVLANKDLYGLEDWTDE